MAVDRRKRPLRRDQGEQRDASLFIVATEGEKTEPLYFSIFRSRRLKLITLECQNGHSSPESVLARIAKFKNQYQFGKGDTFWLVLDRDQWRVKTLTLVHAECRKRKLSMVISNPQFEVWLALHFENPLPVSITKTAMQKHLKALLGGYTKSSFPVSGLLENCRAACDRARALDNGANAIWPAAPGSRVYQLVDQILTKL